MAQILTWTVIAFAAGVLAVGVVVPRLAGATPYTVLTGSMSPALPPGTLVVVRPTPPEQIGAGSVITYQLRSGEPTVVTHRVVSQGISTGTGEPVFTTRGDANPGPDPGLVRPVQVRGTVWYAVPMLGYAANWLNGPWRGLITIVAAGGLASYALVMFIGAARDRLAVRARGTESQP